MKSDRIKKTFARLKREEKIGLVGYMTAGDPDIIRSEKNIRCALSNGVDILEVGVPFSDPTADGPVIQAATQRALSSNVSLSDVLGMISRIRRDFDNPIILFGYANPFFRYGFEKLCADAAKIGVDGFLVVDMPEEEISPLRTPAKKHGLSCIALVAPTTPEERLNKILKKTSGFIYYIMVTGVTGKRQNVAKDVEEKISVIRRHTNLPIAAGFGISSAEQASLAGKSADAVVVGSALVEAAHNGTLEPLVRSFRAALDRTPPSNNS